MGCCSSRNILSNEDRIIGAQEKVLGLNEHPSIIEMTIKKWIGSEGLTLPRFKKAAFALGMNIGDSTSPDDPLVLLFDHFKNGESFQVTELIAFCVFLTTARPADKAVIWFDIFDSELRMQLSYGQVKNVLAMIFRFTFKILPALAVGEGEKKMSAEAVEIYVNECAGVQDTFLEVYSRKVCPEHTLDKEGFVDQMSVYYKLTYSDGVRQMLRDCKKTISQ